MRSSPRLRPPPPGAIVRGERSRRLSALGLSGARMNEDWLAVIVGLGFVALVGVRLVTQVPW